ncbi:hypothetical protein FA95DRAFT_408482 [Auriscalpium vulgare]|uniref:Uncharacterized protein n=1 Tax=Auriscalpium vulgare TaxID=40419 RepID=A0ACB8RHG2_9AGAM|nr:hypothetical protein FA95DRAFT_408482 [Auriscalpium vulgare]
MQLKYTETSVCAACCRRHLLPVASSLTSVFSAILSTPRQSKVFIVDPVPVSLLQARSTAESIAPWLTRRPRPALAQITLPSPLACTGFFPTVLYVVLPYARRVSPALSSTCSRIPHEGIVLRRSLRTSARIA